MQLPEYLLRKWKKRARVCTTERFPVFTSDGLMLGRTLLAKFEHENLTIHTPRILALLSVAYGTHISANIIPKIQAAQKAYRRGDAALASMHLAHAGLNSIDLHETPLRLFAADWLLKHGVTPQELLKYAGILAKDDEEDDEEDDEDDEENAEDEESNEDDDDSDFNAKHPRQPAGAPGGIGGEFAPKDGSATPASDSGSISADDVRSTIEDGMNGPSRLGGGVQVAIMMNR